jgi:hypothetical protein
MILFLSTCERRRYLWSSLEQGQSSGDNQCSRFEHSRAVFQILSRGIVLASTSSRPVVQMPPAEVQFDPSMHTYGPRPIATHNGDVLRLEQGGMVPQACFEGTVAGKTECIRAE